MDEQYRPDICSGMYHQNFQVMKSLRRLPFLLLPLLGILASCISYERSVAVSRSENNPDYTVSYLFEHDGCRVYRFYDSWSSSFVYFTTQGDVTSIPNDSTRQQTVTYRQKDTKKAGL